MKLKNKIIFLLISTLIIGCSSVDSNELRKAEHSLLKGMNYARENKYTEALKEYSKVLKIESDNIYALKETARAYAILNNYDESLSFYKKALKVNDKDFESLKGISFVYYLTDNDSKALKYINKVPLDQLNIDSQFFKGFLLFQDGDEQEGIFEIEDSFNKAVSFNKEYAEIYMTLLYREKKIEKMRIFLDESKEKYFENENFVIFYAETINNYFYEFDLAEEILKRYIASNDGSNDLYIALAKTIYDGQERKNLSYKKRKSYKTIKKENNTKIKERLKKIL
ncbi:tetratricopeptide repeat protein [Fusobacterium sp. MFO224]|uniref:tetratricopeptide repeat protein n=1 Tax=Fusobacterium sp. MFO224 TaxID=3378070 RepID=UPI0038553A70